MASRKRGTAPSKEEIQFLQKVGRKIGQYTAKRGKSVEHLAYEGEISKGYLYDVVKGEGNPSLIILLRVTAVLEIPLWKLLK